MNKITKLFFFMTMVPMMVLSSGFQRQRHSQDFPHYQRTGSNAEGPRDHLINQFKLALSTSTLYPADYLEHLKNIKHLLDNGISPNLKYHGWDLIYWATFYNDLNLVKLLVNTKKVICNRLNNGEYPIDRVQQRLARNYDIENNLIMLDLLTSCGGKVK